MTRQMKQSLIYSFKVWITGVLCGPFVYHILFSESSSLSQAGLIRAIILEIKLGLIYSLPSLILSILIVALLNTFPINMIVKKATFSILGIFLTVAPLLLLKSSWVPWLIHKSISYSIIIIAAIWLYRLNFNEPFSSDIFS